MTIIIMKLIFVHKVLMDIIFMCLSTYSLVAMIKTDNSGCISKTDNNKCCLGFKCVLNEIAYASEVIVLIGDS